jgi:protocatechuate 3,4-dioxygenase beta subunit
MDEFTRRDSLVRAGGLLAAVLGAAGLEAGRSEGAGPAGVASGEISCVLTPELTDGPFYVSSAKVRRDITEGRPGTPLTLRLKVVNASTCKPIKGAAVDVWHTDALGAYSGVQGNSGTFMRGVQRTDANGIATFKTVYPGWYNGRTVHIHVKVHVRGNVVHTGQLFFPDRTTDAVFKRSPYSRRGARTTRNANDSIYVNGGRKSVVGLAKSGSAYTASLTMGVQLS